MKVLILGIGNPVPTFILRRIRALDESGLILIVVGNASNKDKILLKHGSYAIAPEVKLTDFFIWLNLSFSAILQPFRFFTLWKCFTKQGFFSGFYLALKNWSYVRYKNVDLIHLQWLSMGAEYTWLRKFYNSPIIASARGSQVTVYPETRPGNKENIIKAIQALDAIHCVSQSILQRCIDLGSPPEKTFVNYNGIDTEMFHPLIKERWEDKKDKTFKLITVGALMWRKGIHYQLLLIKELLDQKINVHLHIVGDGPEKEGLQYQVLRLGLNQAITWEGLRTESEIVQLLQTADVYISTSAAEGLANSVVEAASCGLPIVAFECEGMREVVTHETTGFLIPYGNISQMSKYIIELTQSPKKWFSMSVLACDNINHKFNEKYCVLEMVSKYQNYM
jgi:glycosyltransferase involved in cell wall biosynthesis